MKCWAMPIAPAMHRKPWLVSFGAAVLSLSLLAGPAAGQTVPVDDVDPPKTEAEQQAADEALLETLAMAPEESPPSPDDAFVETAEAEALAAKLALERFDATAKSNDANVRAMAAVAELQAATKKETVAKAVRDAAQVELDAEGDRLSELTVQAYVTGGDGGTEEYRALVEGDTTDPAAGRHIIFEQVMSRQEKVTRTAKRNLKAARTELADVRAVVAVTETVAADAMSLAARLNDVRTKAEAAHDAAVTDAKDARASLQAAAGGPVEPVPEGVAIIGLPRLNASDLAGWFAQSPYRPKVATPMEDYARWFIEEGRTEGIRGDIAFAQAVLETGGFANTDSVLGNNFSGIGHYDNLPLGWTFPTPRLGVRAQIQLLKSYAVRKPQYANPLVDKRLRGPAGCCESWGDLTTVWATDPTYGPKVMLLYSSMVEYALQRRARGEGFDDAPAVP